MHFLNKLIPSFLKKLDHHLLLNHRLIWETKFHFVLFYGLSAFIGYTFLGFIYPLSLSSALPNPATVGLIGAIPAFILFCYWIYTQVQYSIESNYGKLFSGLGQWRLLIHFVSAFVFFLPALQLGNLIDNRIAELAQPKELDEDILTLNIGNPFYLAHHNERSSYDKWGRPVVSVLEYLDCTENNTNCTRFNFKYFGNTSHDMFAFYQSGPSDKQQLAHYFKSNNGLYQEQKLGYIKAYKTIFEKYGGYIKASPQQTYQNFYVQNYPQVDLGYQKYLVKDQIKTIQRAQNKMNARHFSEAVKTSLILAFMFSLALYIFKSVGVKDFIISIISLVAVLIGSVAFLAFWEQVINVNSNYFFVGYSATVILFTLSKVISINTKMVYTRFLTVCLVAFTLVSPFLLVWSYISLDMLGSFRSFRTFDSLLNVILAGIFIHVCFTLPWLRKKYLRMKSLPKT